jgi:hypothetical protein
MWVVVRFCWYMVLFRLLCEFCIVVLNGCFGCYYVLVLLVSSIARLDSVSCVAVFCSFSMFIVWS